MNKTIAALATAFALCAPAAFAQNTAPMSAPTAPAAADPATVAAANDMLVSMNYRAVAASMLGQMRQSIPAMMRQSAVTAIDNNPQLDAAQKKAAHEKMEKELPQAVNMIDGVFNDKSLLDEMMREIAQLYARHFTVSELRQIAVFYKTPVGTKMLATMPQIMNESMQLGQRVVMPRVAAIMQKMGPAK